MIYGPDRKMISTNWWTLTQLDVVHGGNILLESFFFYTCVADRQTDHFVSLLKQWLKWSHCMHEINQQAFLICWIFHITYHLHVQWESTALKGPWNLQMQSNLLANLPNIFLYHWHGSIITTRWCGVCFYLNIQESPFHVKHRHIRIILVYMVILT